jgi:hypothetical protein
LTIMSVAAAPSMGRAGAPSSSNARRRRLYTGGRKGEVGGTLSNELSKEMQTPSSAAQQRVCARAKHTHPPTHARSRAHRAAPPRSRRSPWRAQGRRGHA